MARPLLRQGRKEGPAIASPPRVVADRTGTSECRPGTIPAAPPRPTARAPLWHRAAIAGGVVLLLFEALWLFLVPAGRGTVSDIAGGLAAGLAAVCCAGVSRRHPVELRRFWRLTAVSLALSAVGQSSWALVRLVGGPDRVSVSLLVGTLSLGAMLTGTAALLSCHGAPRTAVGRVRAVLDGAIVGLALVPVAWIVVLRDVSGPGREQPMPAVGLIYPMLDLIQLTVLVSIAGAYRPMWRPLTLIGASLGFCVLADTSHLWLVARDAYVHGHPTDLYWTLSYLLVVLATRYPPPVPVTGVNDPCAQTVVPWWRLTLPYLPVGAAIVAIMVARQPAGYVPTLISVTGMALLGTLAVRQGLAAYENSRLAGRLRELAYVDQLTGLPNRLMFNLMLQRAIRDRHRVAVLLLDLDGFKQVNDRFGHASGDALLTSIAARMLAAVGTNAMIARVGGDEFAVIVCGHEANPPEQIAQRLLTALHPSADEEEVGVHPSASIGIAEYGPQHAGQADLLRDADIAMYAAKAAGKSAYRICTPALRDEAVTRAELIADLRRAIDEGGQLELAFQPIVDLSTGRVRGAEALVRWRHPVRGLLSPAVFLPLAEETGLVVAMDRWVMRQACRAAADWQDIAPGASVAVNIAPAHLRRADLTATVAEAATSAGLAPHALTLELTETALIDGTDVVLDRLRELRDLGVRIAIDDFGTGYSSLSYLHRIPATDLKIDRSFVARLDDANPQAYATVEMVSRLAAAFDLVVVAEGVETDRQHAAVAAVGCPRGQGYRYGRPGSLAELRRAMQAR
ncbi:EAL domain-containing protein [Micromonospora sp. CPCC 206060]|uniref:putative bifunctional diguanylate cyclase/phosphodiesterase n=1 Tax=Micromonospora sp. CPCC 206060 TaxID=3122406 RepID=UPI002FF3EA96